MISRDIIDRIMDLALIEEVIGEFVQLKRSGSSYRGLSPFNNEKTPSFFVIPSKGIFKDFSSGKGGSVVTFLMEHEKMSYPEALRWLAKRYNIEIEEEAPNPEALKDRSDRESLLAVTEWAARYFEDNLWKTEEGQTIAHSYFTERGFRDDTIKKFRLGYCLNSWNAMTDAALAAGHDRKWLVAAGLTRQKEEKFFDFFKDRVMFPILDVSGRVIAFGGRILTNDKKTAKYFNSPENALYNKSRVLYGIYQARHEIVKQDRCFLVEGYTDVISLNQSGLENVVASSGTALTEDQVRLIKRYSANVTILYDGDPAGIRASFRGINIILGQGLNVRVVLFPDQDDPDSFARKVSSDELLRYVDKESRDFMTFKTDLLSQEAAGDPVKRAGMIREIVESIACIPDAIKRSVYISECSTLLAIDEQVLLLETNKILRKNSAKPVQRSVEADRLPADDALPPIESAKREAPSPLARLLTVETELARILLRYGRHPVTIKMRNDEDREVEEETTAAEYILSELEHEEEELDIHDEVLQTVVSVFRASITKGVFPEEREFLNNESEKVVRFYCDAIVDRHTLSKNWSERHRIFPETEAMNIKVTVNWCIHKLKQENVMFMLKANEDRLKTSENIQEQDQLLLEHARYNMLKEKITDFFGSAIL